MRKTMMSLVTIIFAALMFGALLNAQVSAPPGQARNSDDNYLVSFRPGTG